MVRSNSPTAARQMSVVSECLDCLGVWCVWTLDCLGLTHQGSFRLVRLDGSCKLLHFKCHSPNRQTSFCGLTFTSANNYPSEIQLSDKSNPGQFQQFSIYESQLIAKDVPTGDLRDI